jgi:branched-chain amino acid transport system permease protein
LLGVRRYPRTIGRAFIPELSNTFLSVDAAGSAGPAAASMLIYVLMGAVLFFRPQGLFPARGG